MPDEVHEPETFSIRHKRCDQISTMDQFGSANVEHNESEPICVVTTLGQLSSESNDA